MDNFSRFGCYHTSCGRVLKNRKTARDINYVDSESSPKIDPVSDAVHGASSYAKAKGLTDPHADIDYHKIRTSSGLISSLGHEYDKLPLDDQGAHRHFQAMRDEVNDQYHHLTGRMGIKVHVRDTDPYKDVHELAHDVRNNHQIQVLGTHATGGHPFFSNEENDRFRAVHDVFGHLATGRDFDSHGEEAAYQAHSRMFSHHALPAMASETRGQNGSLITNGSFGPQRIAVLPHRLWNPSLAHREAGARGDLPEDLSFTHGEPNEYSRMHRIKAISQGHEVGMMHLDSERNNEVGWVKVHPMHVRQGIASAMWDHAQSLGLNPQHSDIQSQSGRAWSKTTPELEKVSALWSQHVADRTQAPKVRENLSRELSMQSQVQLHAVKDRWLLGDMPLGFTMQAHVSGNQIDVLHCPFCGSGAVIGRSDGTVECGYCTSVFTVQVQPAFNGFPQSVDGMPYQWPGMPDPTMGGVMTPGTPSGTNMAPPMGSPDAIAGGAPPDGPGTEEPPMPPDMSSDPGEDDEEVTDDEDPKSDGKKDKKKGNPFAKKKSYRNANGKPLDVDEYVAHLAIRFANDPLRVAAKVKSARERGDL